MTYSLFAEQNKILHWQGRSSPTLLLPLLVVERKQQYNRERDDHSTTNNNNKSNWNINREATDHT